MRRSHLIAPGEDLTSEIAGDTFPPGRQMGVLCGMIECSFILTSEMRHQEIRHVLKCIVSNEISMFLAETLATVSIALVRTYRN